MHPSRVGPPGPAATWLLLILVVGMVTLAFIAGPVALALPMAIAAVTGLVKAVNQPRSERKSEANKNGDSDIKRL